MNGFCAIPEKTKWALIVLFELLIRGSGPSPLCGHNQRGPGYINPIGSELRFPPRIAVTLKREAKLHDCSGFILGETLLG